MKPIRSVLSVPGNRAEMHEKARCSAADMVMLDLEDSVPPEEKKQARQTVVRTISDLAWKDKALAVRINALDTPFGYKDAVEVAEAVGDKLDLLVLPKTNTPGDIHFLDRLLSGIELACGHKFVLNIEAAIETAAGLNQVSAIAAASQRLASLSFGVADYTASVGAGLASVSGHGENDAHVYPGHRWHFPLSRMIMAAKANGCFAVDAPFGNFKDSEGLKASATMAKALGCDGKWAIHPAQIDTINQVFSPTPEEIERALKILKTAKEAGHTRGAVAIDGKMVDQATIRLARRVRDHARHLGLVAAQ
ncbi:MAG TPA: CoA ester lyase [Desulfobacteraceae bacterium]|nr:CoA ester lyase [Desulfobacteraceae bacterium]